MTNKQANTLDLAFIQTHYGYTMDELGEMRLKELFVLEENARQEILAVEVKKNLLEEVGYWKKFFKTLPFFLENGFEETDIDEVLATFKEQNFLVEKAMPKGEKPYGQHVFLRSGRGSIGKDRRLRDVDVYHVPSDDFNQQKIACKVFQVLMEKRLPFLENYQWKVYQVGADQEVYVLTDAILWRREEHASLYVPIQALLTCSTDLVRKRMVDYFDVATKGIFCSSEMILNSLAGKAFLEEMEEAKKQL